MGVERQMYTNTPCIHTHVYTRTSTHKHTPMRQEGLWGIGGGILRVDSERRSHSYSLPSIIFEGPLPPVVCIPLRDTSANILAVNNPLFVKTTSRCYITCESLGKKVSQSSRHHADKVHHLLSSSQHNTLKQLTATSLVSIGHGHMTHVMLSSR